jgi:hypothetical protein
VFEASLLVEKNKEGWTGGIDLLFDAEKMTFKEKSTDIKPVSKFIPVVNLPYAKDKDEDPF